MKIFFGAIKKGEQFAILTDTVGITVDEAITKLNKRYHAVDYPGTRHYVVLPIDLELANYYVSSAIN